MDIFFNPNDTDVRQFLLEIGFSASEVESEQTGIVNDILGTFGLRDVVDKKDERKSINTSLWRVDTLVALAGDEENGGQYRLEDIFLSPSEAKKGMGLIQKYGKERISSLFKKGVCPSTAKGTFDKNSFEEYGAAGNAGIVMHNLLGHESIGAGVYIQSNNIAVIPQQQCGYDPDTPIELLRGIHFPLDMAPPHLSTVQEAVAGIIFEEKIIGTATLISAEGHVITAEHVIGDKQPEDLKIHYKGQIYSLGKQSVVFRDDQSDLALLQLPELSGKTPLKVAASFPVKETPIWVVGFPGQMDRSGFMKLRHPTFTPGMVLGREALAYEDTTARKDVIHMNAETSPGYSGGPIMDRDGNFVGVLSGGRSRTPRFFMPNSIGTWIQSQGNLVSEAKLREMITTHQPSEKQE